MDQIPPSPPQSHVGSLAGIAEAVPRRGVFRLEKFRQRAGECDGSLEPLPFETLEFENAYVNTGGALFLNKLIGAAGTVFDNTNAFLGVGDSATATTAGMTDLQAATNKLRKAMDATFPSLASQTMTWKSTFGSADANFAWNEVGLFNASAAGTMLSRGVQSLGTKASGTTWVLSYTIAIP